MLVETPMRIQEAIHSCGHIDRMHARNNPSGYVFALWLCVCSLAAFEKPWSQARVGHGTETRPLGLYGVLFLSDHSRLHIRSS